MMDGSKPDAPRTREERLAAQLRANLRRRKQQARALEQGAGQAADGSTPAAPDAVADGDRAPD